MPDNTTVSSDTPEPKLSVDATTSSAVPATEIVSPSPPASLAKEERKPAWMAYTVGGKGDSGDNIVEILQRLPKCFVYVNQEHSLSWEFDPETCVDPDGSGAEAMQLISQVTGSVLGGRRRRRLLSHIADALAAALSSKREGDGRDFFAHARAFVEATRAESLRLAYLISAFGTTVTVVLLLLSVDGANWLAASLSPFFVASALAAIGALLSVLLRFNAVAVDTYTSRFYISLGGISRIVVGSLFGSVFLMFYNAQLLLSVVKGAPAIAVASLLAGFSERLIPELLGAFEAKVSSAAGTK